MVTHCDQVSYLESQTVCLTMYYVVFQQIEWPSLGVVGLVMSFFGKCQFKVIYPLLLFKLN